MGKTQDITPALVTDVSFNEEIQLVKGTLQTKTAAMGDVKKAWNNVTKLLEEYGVEVPYRRVDPESARGYASKVVVYLPLPKASESKLNKILGDSHHDVAYYLGNLSQYQTELTQITKVFPGVAGLHKLAVAANEYRNYREPEREVDEAKTEAARQKVRTAVDKYAESVLKYEETVDTLQNVSEYIGVVEKIANVAGTARKNG